MPVRQAGEAMTDQRRDQMLDAAAALIAERGFSDTRITDVAARVGASPALVIYYFGTKDKLLTAALRHSEDGFYADAEALLRRTRSTRKRLETLVGLTCVPQGDDDGGSWGLWFDLWAQALRHPTVASDRVELDQRWRDLIARVVSEGITGGEIEPTDPDDFALTFAALLDGLAIQVALADPVMTSRKAQSVAMRFAASELGFRWRAPRSSDSAHAPR